MAGKKRKTQKKTSNKTESNHEITGIILVTTGILILFSIASGLFSKSSSSGFIGDLIRKLLFAVLGLGAYIFPFIIIFIGICYIIKKGKISFNIKFYGINLFIMNTLLLIQMIKLDKFYTKGLFKEGFSKILESESIFHGGIIGYIIDVPMYNLFSDVGCYIIFCSLYVISIILIFQISLYDVFSILFKNVKAKKKAKPKKEKVNDIIIENNMSDSEALIACDNEKNGFIKNINKKIKIIDFMKINNDNKVNEINEINEVNDVNEKSDINDEKFENDVQDDIELNVEQTIEQAEEQYRSDNVKAKASKEKKSNNKDQQKISKELEKEIEKNALIIEENVEYKYPSIELLKDNDNLKSKKSDKRGLLNSAGKLQSTLESFGVKAKVVQVTKGPSVTRFEIQPEPGVKVSKIVNLSDDIALNLAASGVRIEAPIPGKAAVGIEVPNKDVSPVYLREVIESDQFTNSTKNLAFSLGKDIGGNCIIGDLSKMPHALVAGATGSGKSVCINSMIISLLYKYSPDDVKLLLIDPKVVELSVYNGIPHLLIPVVSDPKKAAGALNWAVNEMTRRYKAFADNGVRNIEGYNELVEKGTIDEKMPWVVIIIDELADLMMVCPKDVEDYIARLAQMARAAGMHLVIATQRPSVDVITGMIKANIPSRISFAVSSQIDSRTILDSSGAEKLLGKGDMLYYPVGASKPMRIQGAFISEAEVERVVTFIKEQGKDVQYKDEIIDEIDNNASGISKEEKDVDSLLSEAIEFVIKNNYASTSMLQRKFKIGYNRAARIIDEMEERNIISGRNGSKPRQVLVTKDELDS